MTINYGIIYSDVSLKIMQGIRWKTVENFNKCDALMLSTQREKVKRKDYFKNFS